MIESIEFTNYKALRKTTLPLAPFTLLLGPNGSGKSSVLQALRGIALLAAQPVQNERNIGLQFPGSNVWVAEPSVTATSGNTIVEITPRIRWEDRVVIATFRWNLP